MAGKSPASDVWLPKGIAIGHLGWMKDIIGIYSSREILWFSGNPCRSPLQIYILHGHQKLHNHMGQSWHPDLFFFVNPCYIISGSMESPPGWLGKQLSNSCASWESLPSRPKDFTNPAPSTHRYVYTCAQEISIFLGRSSWWYWWVSISTPLNQFL